MKESEKSKAARSDENEKLQQLEKRVAMQDQQIAELKYQVDSLNDLKKHVAKLKKEVTQQNKLIETLMKEKNLPSPTVEEVGTQTEGLHTLKI